MCDITAGRSLPGGRIVLYFHRPAHKCCVYVEFLVLPSLVMLSVKVPMNQLESALHTPVSLFFYLVVYWLAGYTWVSSRARVNLDVHHKGVDDIQSCYQEKNYREE